MNIKDILKVKIDKQIGFKIPDELADFWHRSTNHWIRRMSKKDYDYREFITRLKQYKKNND